MPVSGLSIALGVAAMLPFASARGAGEQALPVFISPDHEFVRYVGRFDRSDPKQPRFTWPGSSITFRFQGTALNVLFRDECWGGKNKRGGNNNNYFNVLIDSQPPRVLALEKGRKVYRAAESLKTGVHTVTLFRRTGPRFNPVRFLGIQLEAGQSLRTLPPPRTRCIEVIGDSISVGYGIEGKDKHSPAIPLNENNYMTYGALTARALDADFVCIAWSGEGVLRDLKGRKNFTLPILYDRTLPQDKNSVWPFKAYTPDVVVINLGTNDFSPGVPTKESFNGAYRALVGKVWRHAPKAHVFCTVGPMVSNKTAQTTRTYLLEMIGAFAKEGRKNIHFVAFPQEGSIPGGIGGQWHPSRKAHRVMAGILIQAIKGVMGW